ncbi:hypothetical protein ACNKHR_15105 [Shigella flexneri]
MACWICRRLRSQSNPMPIIMVTAKGEEMDRWSAWRLALTTTFPNRLTRVNCWPVSVGCSSSANNCQAHRRGRGGNCFR